MFFKFAGKEKLASVPAGGAAAPAAAAEAAPAAAEEKKGTYFFCWTFLVTNFLRDD